MSRSGLERENPQPRVEPSKAHLCLLLKPPASQKMMVTAPTNSPQQGMGPTGTVDGASDFSGL